MRLKVVVRVRPMSQREKLSGSQQVLSVDTNNNIAVTNIKVPEQNAGDSRERVRRFAFDYCFSEDTTQDQIFETVENIVGTSLKRRNHSCVLAYGQTSSGKTHTMMGLPHDPGLTPRLCRRIFKYFEEGALSNETSRMNVSVSYLEIYNEKVADLLGDNTEKKSQCQDRPLKVREHPKKGPYVEGLSQHVVTTDTELLERLEAGTSKRRVGSTTTNPKSSRSHSVFSVSCDGVKLHLVDLAGNERAGSRGYGPSRFREGANINKSLVALGNVISTLADQSRSSFNSRNKFVPYRDSVLTWLLKDTLQGNSNTVMIATVSPSSTYYNETVNTLRFGQRAKLIVYKPVIVEDFRENTIRELRAEIARLRSLLLISKQIPTQTQMNATNLPPKEPEELLSEKESSQTNESEPPIHQTDNSSPQEDLNISETLVPIMSVKSTIEPATPKKLRRTISMDRRLSTDTDNSKSFSSQESLQSPKHKASAKTPTRRLSGGSSTAGLPPVQPKQTMLSLRRQSINRSNPSLKAITEKKILAPGAKKVEKGNNTEVSGGATKKPSYTKPRAQIVAAVTSRLYNKVHKKDIGTLTEQTDIDKTLEGPKELSICSNARNRLREITQRALKAHRSRNEETQTELFPILRVKEVATDCSDLRQQLSEVKDASTLDKQEYKDAQTDCALINQFLHGDLKNILVLTKSCGVQTSGDDTKSNISFTKYLTECQSNNPIFTEAVNINISHNYINGNRTGSLSDDSLDSQRNVSFPTPDLISNHNSLDPHALNAEDEDKKTCYAENNILPDIYENVNYLPASSICASNASVLTVPCYNNFKSVEVLTAHAPQVVLQDLLNQKCQSLPDFRPKLVKAKIRTYLDDKHGGRSIKYHKPNVLICHDSSASESTSESEDNYNLPDSIEYHRKKVQFANKNKRKKSDRMLKAMKDFLEEAKTLMTNITSVAHNTNCQQPHLEDFDIQVTVKDISGLEKTSQKKRKRIIAHATQTDQPPSRESCFSQTSLDFPEYLLPINKYETLLEDSCKRLEEQIKKTPRSRHISITSEDYDDDMLYDRPKYNPWDLSHVEIEDSSLESNPITFSDYGSLPRKTHKRQRTPTCSPSAFLKQLTHMRRQIIESSREELLQGTSEG
ncbi:unnamed protein product [Ceutorhynchus assimilis]|uniref:Kinesin motor domain-containing protein n=1 Tax=Ceutorhynchus assimilis TaxID=467358 RepID=A0A9N9MNZ8_9CUCU|nr:unnamed protein product [Ceutorhynchus assimilis]